jgi:hypothetical protein
MCTEIGGLGEHCSEDKQRRHCTLCAEKLVNAAEGGYVLRSC